MKEAATVEEENEAAAERRAASAEAAAAHLLDEPAPLVRAVAEAGVVVSPGRLLSIKTRRLFLLLLAHRAALMGRAATKWADGCPTMLPRDLEKRKLAIELWETHDHPRRTRIRALTTALLW